MHPAPCPRSVYQIQNDLHLYLLSSVLVLCVFYIWLQLGVLLFLISLSDPLTSQVGVKMNASPMYSHQR